MFEGAALLHIYVGTWSRVILLSKSFMFISRILGIKWYVIGTSEVTLAVDTGARFTQCTPSRLDTVPGVLGCVCSLVRTRSHTLWLIVLKPL
jgi:hypothetical protein